ncbi:MAG: hypothetical protein JWL81_2419 [Verrucomicrobiales bacterium]|nr:hypothetical protein [Verrucomicrobiales bacterium]
MNASSRNCPRLAATLAFAALPFCANPAVASIAYGSINNFDTVNDTGHECHGFEIELEDCHSSDITYTYDYNHYGVPKITQDDSIAGHPKCIIRWQSAKKADGSWAAHTAIPAGPLAPTDGHSFTNPSVNFGGEHFGAGYSAQPTAIRYRWLIDNGSGVLVDGGAVQVATPTFVYYPPVPGGAAGGQVQAEIRPPEAPEIHALEFGIPVWVKEIRTTSHNNKKVKLRDLVSDDPADPDDANWRNGEADEVETEWELMQTEFNQPEGGAKGKKQAAAEDLDQGDEVVTRRYEFFKYIGPLDPESGEAVCDSVGPDDLHGSGTAIINGVETDMSTIEIVGEFTGSQMAAVDVDAAVSLIEHVNEGEAGTAYTDRTVVVGGALPFSCILEGGLPAGMSFDDFTGILSGTPETAGDYLFKITATDGMGPDVSRSYTLRIAPAGEALPPGLLVDTVSAPLEGGTTAGDGSYDPDTEATVTAIPQDGFHFVSWTDHGKVVATTPEHTFVMDINHSLTANFAPDGVTYLVTTAASPPAGGTVTGGGSVDAGSNVTLTAVPNNGYAFVNWTEGNVPVSNTATWTFSATASLSVTANFIAADTFTIAATALPAAGGTATGTGPQAAGTSVTLHAIPSAGYSFLNWTEAGNVVSSAVNYTFTASANRSLSANFRVNSTATTPKAADEYTLTDITSLTPAQLAALPWFDRYVPVPAAGTPDNFVAIAQSGAGAIAGYMEVNDGVIQNTGALVSNGAVTSVPAFGQYEWTAAPGNAAPPASGFFENSPLTDVAFTGRPIGYSTLTGTGADASSYQEHAFVFDPATGTKTDLTPAADRAMASSINDLEAIVGTWENSAGFHAFKRLPDGTMQEFNTVGFPRLDPRLITNHGLVAGTFEGATTLPFAIVNGGLTPVSIGLPDTNSPDSARITDANDHGIIVGHSFQAASPDNTSATRWWKDGGDWIAEDLNDLYQDGGFVFDNALAVNDAGYIIATGHPEGSAERNTRTFLLTPDRLPPPSIVTLAPTTVKATSAVLLAKVNACTKSTTVSFSSGTGINYTQTLPVPGNDVTGMNPTLRTVTLTGLTPNTLYHIQGTAVNSKGTTLGGDITFRTAHDLGTWTDEEFGGEAGNPAIAGPEEDNDHDGQSNFAEYAFGHDPKKADSNDDLQAEFESYGLSLTWKRPKHHGGVKYRVEVSTSPNGPWLSGDDYIEEVSCHEDDDSETTKNRSRLDKALHPRQFMRVVAEAGEDD